MLSVHQSNSLLPSTVDKCVEHLQTGAVVVVETQRFKHLVADGYNRTMLDSGLRAWPTPEVFTMDAWLSGLWREHGHHRENAPSTLLSSGQATQTWEQVIGENIRKQYQTGYEYLLWHITATANNVKFAYQLMCSYDIQPAQFGDAVSNDVEQFLIWLESYQKNLKQRKAIDQECLPDRICDVAKEIFAAKSSTIVFAGFDSWTPQRERLLEALRQVASVVLVEHETVSRATNIERLEFTSTDREIDACARWARQVIDANPENHRVGIVVPSLSQVGTRLGRQLSAYLNPDAVMEGRQTNLLSFHMTLSGALSETPIVVDAMNLLELIRNPVSLDVMKSVILSDRNKGWESEYAARATFAEELYALGSEQLSIDDVLTLAARYAERIPILLRMLRKARQLLSEQPSTADYAYWGRFFMDWMKNFQSTQKGDRQFGLDEWQAYRSWVSIVEGLAELGFVSRRCRVETALAKLIRRVGESSVQPRAVRVPVQVGEYITMAGQTFTHLWMLGMNEKSLPGSPQPNPFVPIAVQKQFGIPTSSSTTLNEQMFKRCQRIVASAEHIVQSYALMDGGEHFQRSIALVHPQAVKSDDLNHLFSLNDYPQIVSNERHKLERFADWQAPPLDSAGRVAGGTTLLAHQSLCPFRAFAMHRLQLTQQPSVEFGVSRMTRGSMLHRALELFYNTYLSSESIRQAYASGEIQVAIDNFARQAVEEYNDQRIKPIDKQIADIEVAILTNLIGLIAYRDSGRDNFEIYATEIETEVTLADVTLRLKIDRAEVRSQLGGENYFRLSDYKTGYCSLSKLLGIRPEDPQLLIYALAFEQQSRRIDDVEYIQLKDGQLKIHSWSKRAGSSNSKFAPIETAMVVTNGWKDVLEKLAKSFGEGWAVADPLKNDTCKYCDAGPVCRITTRAEHLLSAGDSESG